jgi:hypothetical protein
LTENDVAIILFRSALPSVKTILPTSRIPQEWSGGEFMKEKSKKRAVGAKAYPKLASRKVKRTTYYG